MQEQPSQQTISEQPVVPNGSEAPPAPATPFQSAYTAPEVQTNVPDSFPAAAQPSVAQVIEWQASEYIDREKTTIWFIGLGLATLALLAVAIFLIQDITFAILVVVMAIAIAVIARRPAKSMNYRLSFESLMVNDKTFSLRDFRAFGVIQEGAVYSVTLLPNKRFAPSVNVHFPPEYGEQIVDILGALLPMEHVAPDLIDQLTSRLHF